MNYASQTEYMIGGVTVTGTEFLDKDQIIIFSGLIVGSKVTIPGDDISKAIRTLWSQKLFADIEIRITKIVGSAVFLDIKVVERAKLSRFRIDGPKNTGPKKGEKEDIRERIRLTSGRIVTENTKNHTATIIKNFYYEKGFLNTQVTFSETKDTNVINGVELLIWVDKGVKVKISEINIYGNEQLGDYAFKRKLKNTHEKVHLNIHEIFNRKNIREAMPDSASFTGAMNNLAPSRMIPYLVSKMRLNLFKTSKFIRKEYKADKQGVIAHYNSMGYRDAKIVRDSVYITGNNMRIDIYVDEGHQYYFRNITWRGNTQYTSQDLNKLLAIKKGDIYNQTLLNEKLNMSPTGADISSLYMDKGHLFFQIQPIEIAVVGDSIDVEIRIMEGPVAIINEVRIYGNTKTKEHVIRRELRTLPGSTFSRTDLIRSQREIVNLGYFDPELLEVIPIPNPENGTVDIEYHVVEKPSDQLELSAGWGGRGQGVVGTLGVSFTNFSIQNMFKKGTWSPLPTGDGQRLSLRVQTNGKVYQSFNASFTEPWLGGKKPNSFSVSWFMTRLSDLDAERRVEGKLITNGGSIGLGTRLKWPDDWFTFQAILNFQSYLLDNWTSSNFIITDGRSNNLSLKLVLARDSRNAPLYTTSGSLIQLSLQMTPPYSAFNKKDYSDLSVNEKYRWVEYHKWRFTAEWYIPLTGKANPKMPVVLRVAAKFGFLGYYNDQIGYSPFERFELGGDGISNIQYFGRDIVALRGYEVITPNSGAPFFDKFTLEMRFPISLNPQATIYAHAFAEGGNYWNTIKEVNPFDMKRSAGVGLRIFLPMFGLLGFDYGIGFDKNLGGSTGFGDYLGQYGKFSIVLGFEPD